VVRLSVNVNKVATVRNSRGGTIPSVVDAARACVSAGARGITVHPRHDARHITPTDVIDLSKAFAAQWGRALEYNIEGDPRPDWLDMVCSLTPAQATLVPVSPGEVTSQAGWKPNASRSTLEPAIERRHAKGIRVSLFVEAEPAPIEWAKALGADRVELYTEPYARAFERGASTARAELSRYVRAATLAHSLGLGVNAGHDLDLENLPLFVTVPHLDEVSSGHALVSRALFVGLEQVVKEYLAALGT
jgi:pyridoxine 5-phosphate synthase